MPPAQVAAPGAHSPPLQHPKGMQRAVVGGRATVVAQHGQGKRSASTRAATSEPGTAEGIEGEHQGLDPPPTTTQGRILAVTPKDATSPYAYPLAVPGGYAPWEEALRHLGRRVHWAEPTLHMDVFTLGSSNGTSWLPEPMEAFAKAAMDADMVLFVGVQDVRAAQFLIRNTMHIPTSLAFDSCPELEDQTRLLFQPKNALFQQAARLFPLGRGAEDARLVRASRELFSRKTPNDFVYMILSVMDSCVTPVQCIQANNKKQGLDTAMCVARNCGRQTVDCMLDENCRKAFDCLNKCGLNDQVCSYRCIVSYESQKLQEFSFCNLQKHNCLNNYAEKPKYPAVRPLTEFRGSALTHEMAEEIFEGWLVQKQWSWMVVCGQNPAYDVFPCQFQIFYYGKGGKSFWYDPVFKVITQDGRETWRRRHYRVRRADEPGTFHFSVLDNGVTSNEFWRIVDVHDNLRWALFYYSGAASAAGQAYSGAVLVTPDGQWPGEEEVPRIEAALDRCGIKFWEMYEVDNRSCSGSDGAGEPPLGSLPI